MQTFYFVDQTEAAFGVNKIKAIDSNDAFFSALEKGFEPCSGFYTSEAEAIEAMQAIGQKELL